MKKYIFLFIIMSNIVLGQIKFGYPLLPYSSPQCDYFTRCDCGYCSTKGHIGMDFIGSKGDIIYAVGDGVVYYVENKNSNDHAMGNNIMIEHTLLNGTKILSTYSHLNEIFCNIKIGTKIFKGDRLGKRGASGKNDDEYWNKQAGCSSCNYHLHFEFRNIEVLQKPDGAEKDDTWGNSSYGGVSVNSSWGYVSKNNNPELYGYYDPANYLNLVSFKGNDIILNFGSTILAGRAENPQSLNIIFKKPSDKILSTANKITQFKIGNQTASYTIGTVTYLGSVDGYDICILPINIPANIFQNNQSYDIQFDINFTDGTSLKGFGKNQIYFTNGNNFNDLGITTAPKWYKQVASNSTNYGLLRGFGTSFGNPNCVNTPTLCPETEKISFGTAARLAVWAGLKVRTLAEKGIYDFALPTSVFGITACDESFPYFQILKKWGYNSVGTIDPKQEITENAFAEILRWALPVTATTLKKVEKKVTIASGSTNATAMAGFQNTYITKTYSTDFTYKDNIGTLSNNPTVVSITGTNYLNRATLAKYLVNAYEGSYRVNNGGTNPNTRTTLVSDNQFSVIGDKYELSPDVSGSPVPSQIFTHQPTTLVSGQQIDFLFNSTEVNGSPLHYYWSIDGGDISAVANTNYRRITFTAPTVASQTTFHLYAYTATLGGYIAENFIPIIVNPTGTPPAASGVSMQLSTTSLDFGSLAVNATADRTLTITNPSTSTGSLIGSITLPATSTGFSLMVGSTSFNLAPGQSSALTLRFQSASGGSFNAPISITHNASNVSNPVSVNLQGIATAGTQTPTLNCVGAIPLTCEVIYTGTTTGGTNNVSQYGENNAYFPISESGPEKVHTFTANTTGVANFVFSETAAGYLDIFVLNTCGSTINTIARAGGGTDIRGNFNVTAGQTYYLVVDGANGASGAYSLKVECPAGSSGGSGGGGTSCATVNKTSIDFGFIGSGSYGGQYFTISNPTSNYAQGWVRFVGQHGSKFGVFVPNVGYLTEYQYSLNPNQSITLEVLINADISANFQAQAKITFEGTCTASPFYINLRATNVPTIAWATNFSGKVFNVCNSSNNAIQWTSNALNPYSDAAIEYSLDGGITWLPYFYSPPNNLCGGASGSNCVANDGSDDFTPMGVYTKFGKMRIRYDCYDTNLPWIVSSGFFKIKDTPNNQMNMVFPDLQETLTCGQNITIQFQDTGYGGYLTVGYSTDNGVTKIPIATNIYQDGSWPKSYTQAWTVPNNINSQTVKFYVSSPNGGYIDWSDANNIITCTVPPTVTVNPSINQPSCVSATNGSISLSASGATTYTYSWKKNGGAYGTNSSSIGSLGIGTYAYTVTGNNGAVSSGTINLVSANPLTITEIVTNATCTKNNGTASISVSPSTIPITYSWNSGESVANISSKQSGSYTLTVTQPSTGCSFTKSIYIPSIISPVSVTFNSINTICQGATINLIATPSGGTTPYTYLWSNGNVGSTSIVGSGNYQCVVTDANGCQVNNNLIVNEYPSMSLTSSVTDAIGCGVNNGSVNLIVNNAVSPYSTVWNDGVVGLVRTNLASNNYFATLTDANNCKKVVSVFVNTTEEDILHEGAGFLPNGTYKGKTVIGRKDVNTGTIYKGKEYVLLEAGFKAGGNEVFTAQIESCNTNILAALYNFNGNANDATGNNNTGVPLGGIGLNTGVKGEPNGAYCLDGINDYINTPIQQTNISSYSISAWVRTSVNRYYSGGAQVVAQTRGGVNQGGKSITLVYDTNEGRWSIAMDTDFLISGTGVVYSNNNEWTHIVGVWDGRNGSTINSNQFKIYINGILQNSSYYGSQNTNIASPISGLGTTKIGYHQAWNTYFQGCIDNVRIYNNQSLTEADVLSIYNQEKPVAPTSGQVGYYPFNGNSYDESGGDKNLTNTNATLTTDRRGIPNSAYYFNETIF